jgi:hypothetical protein
MRNFTSVIFLDKENQFRKERMEIKLFLYEF